MDLLSHIAFANIITGNKFSLQVFIGSILPDLDKFYTYSKGKFRRAESRTWFQELPFLSVISLAFVGMGLVGVAQGIAAHFALDFLTGETRPFSPFSKKTINFNYSLRVKAVLAVIIWVLYLSILI